MIKQADDDDTVHFYRGHYERDQEILDALHQSGGPLEIHPEDLMAIDRLP